MKRGVVIILTLVAFVAVSCAPLQEHKGAAAGAAIGATMGAITGSAVAQKRRGLEGAIIGGTAGAIVGGLIGHYAYDVRRSQAETNAMYGYQGNGITARIENVNIEPRYALPGGTIDTFLTYAVLAPQNQVVRVKEVRELWYGSQFFGRPETVVDRPGGTFQSNTPIVMPADAPRGTYTIRFMVEIDTQRDYRDMTFILR